MHGLANVLVASSSKILENGTYASDFNICSLTRFDDVLFH